MLEKLDEKIKEYLISDKDKEKEINEELYKIVSEILKERGIKVNKKEFFYRFFVLLHKVKYSYEKQKKYMDLGVEGFLKLVFITYKYRNFDEIKREKKRKSFLMGYGEK